MGAQPIHYMGHVRMMAAAQPFISGAISKTVNMPEEATVEEVEQLFVESWKLGLKAVAIYRDNCKVAQPLSADKKQVGPDGASGDLAHPVRKRLPMSRPSTTTSFQVGDAEGYVTAGSYPDDGLGEIFLKTSKQGSTLAGVMDAFAIAVSIGLQYGVPLETYVSKFINTKFEPSGMTNDPDIRFATSMIDYVFRRLALDYLPVGDARRAGDQIHRRAHRSLLEAELAAKGGDARDRGGRARAAQTVDIVRGVLRQGQRRAAVLQLRLEDAAGWFVLRLLELRQHERLFLVRSARWALGARRWLGVSA